MGTMYSNSNSDDKLSFSIQKSFFSVLLLIGIGYLLYAATPVVVPLAFALITSFILYPVVRFLEVKGFNRILAIALVLVVITALLGSIIYLFSKEIIEIVGNFHGFRHKLDALFQTVAEFINQYVNVVPDTSGNELMEAGKEWGTKNSDEALQSTFIKTSTILSQFVLGIIYLFLILLYRNGLVEAFTRFTVDNKRIVMKKMLSEIQKIGQKYITGMLLLMAILGLLNSTALLLIGVDYPFFFGYMAAMLAVIPYVGSTLGGAIPMFYAFMNNDSYWPAIGVFLSFWFIQIIEGNILSPRIVGGSLNLNALAAIIVLILGGLLWGIPGMILALPFAAIFRVICSYYKELEPIGRFLEDDLYNGSKKKSYAPFRRKK